MTLPCGITKSGDRFYLSRKHGDNIDWMDRRYQRYSTSRREIVWLDQPPEVSSALGYVGKCADKRAVLVGKGPSFDSWAAKPMPPHDVIVTINEAFVACPCSPDYAFCLEPEPLKRMATTIPMRPRTIWVLPQHLTKHVPEGTSIARFAFGEFGTRPGMATADAALRWLWTAGVRRVLMVGFDGIDEPERTEYALAVQAAGAPATKAKSWEKVNRDVLAALAATGLEAEWFHRSISGQAAERAESLEVESCVGPE